MASALSIDVVPLLPKHRQQVINLLMSSFFLEEPLNQVLEFEIPREPLSWTEYTLDVALRDQCSFVAIDTNTPHEDVVGVILNGISDRAHKEILPTITSEKLNFIFSITGRLSDRHDLYKLYNTDRLFHCDIVNVDEKQRGQNLSHRLIASSIDQARQLGIKGASVTCTSIYSRKAFIHHGFDVIDEVLYSDCGDPRILNMGVHDRCTLLARKL